MICNAKMKRVLKSSQLIRNHEHNENIKTGFEIMRTHVKLYESLNNHMKYVKPSKIYGNNKKTIIEIIANH